MATDPRTIAAIIDRAEELANMRGGILVTLTRAARRRYLAAEVFRLLREGPPQPALLPQPVRVPPG